MHEYDSVLKSLLTDFSHFLFCLITGAKRGYLVIGPAIRKGLIEGNAEGRAESKIEGAVALASVD